MAARAVGDQWRLLAAISDLPQVAEVEWAAAGSGLLKDGYRIVPGSGGVAGRLAVVRPSGDTRTPDDLVIAGTSYPVTHAPDLPGGIGNPFTHYWVTAPNPVALTIGSTYGMQVDFTGDAKLYADLNADINDIVAWDGYEIVVVDDVHSSEDVEQVLEENQREHGQFVRSETRTDEVLITKIVGMTEDAFQARRTAGTLEPHTAYFRI